MINRGTFIAGTDGYYYLKIVSFSKAVLWFKRELSIPKYILTQATEKKVTRLIFRDQRKKENWIFLLSDIIEHGHMQQVGQEPQWYFPIDDARKEKYGETGKPTQQTV